MSVFRIYVEKKEEFAVEASHVLSDIRTALSIQNLQHVRLLNRYDVEGVSEEVFRAATTTILSEPAVDVTYDELPQDAERHMFAIEYLPGQFDQRADSAAQCISIMTSGRLSAMLACIFYPDRLRKRNLRALRLTSSTQWKAVRRPWKNSTH